MTQTQAARVLTDFVDPKNVILALCLLVGVNYGWPGVGWAAVAVLFCAAVPIAFIVLSSGEKSWAARHVPDKARRMVVIPVIVLSVMTCLTLMVVGNAPRAMLAMVGAMLATLAVLWPVTKVWDKISFHTSVLSGALAMLGLLYGPWWILSAALIPAVAWSRNHLNDHTVPQTIAGAIVGVVVAGPVFLLGL